MARFKIISIIILAVLLLIVILQNTEVIETRLLFATVAMPRAALLAIAVLIGVIIGLVTGLRISRKPKPAAVAAKPPK